MNILRFNNKTFGFYEFSQNILNSPLANHNLNIVLNYDTYVIYEANSRVVIDMGRITYPEDWVNILRPTFEHVARELVWADDDILSSIFLTKECVDELSSKDSSSHPWQYYQHVAQDIINVINKKFEILKYAKETLPMKIENSIGSMVSAQVTQKVVNGDWNLNNVDAWYLSWSLDYTDNVSNTTANIGDIYIDQNKSYATFIYPRKRLLQSIAPNRIKLITQVLGAKDTNIHGISGIEYKLQ